MVGPNPTRLSYIGGISVMTSQLIQNWSKSPEIIQYNTTRYDRDFASTGKLNVRNFWSFIINICKLSYIIWTSKPIIVHIHTSVKIAVIKDMLIAAWLKYIFGARIILHIHNAMLESILISKSMPLKRCQIWAIRKCSNRTILLSGNLLDQFMNISGKSKSKVRDHCIVMHNFTILPRRTKLVKKTRSDLNIFFIGNVGVSKGVYDIIQAAKMLTKEEFDKTVYFTIAGPFDSKDEELRIKTLVCKLGVEKIVRFIGPVSGTEKEQQFLSADIFVLPSYGEGIPISLLEAMAYGLPVVVSNVGGIPEIVCNEIEGKIIKSGDVKELCSALSELIRSAETRKKMGDAAKMKIATNYLVESYVQKLQKLYHSLLTSQAL